MAMRRVIRRVWSQFFTLLQRVRAGQKQRSTRRAVGRVSSQSLIRRETRPRTRLLALPHVEHPGRAGQRWIVTRRVYLRVSLQVFALWQRTRVAGKERPLPPVGSGSGRAELELSPSRLGELGLRYRQAVALEAEP
ncbi:hypothetical protein K466DRAFT_589013 [Polyporus arcularius HHB13444]|uniref:Uncharacterized protein n=1 Tax=Polyporus arcularius HHB13444 TaxID=1314778 RepID=A0A5C3P801_9APHY|nr:hypothetical protein K466DRAFT_589013 [Polyporus arcularius HHB13444]